MPVGRKVAIAKLLGRRKEIKIVALLEFKKKLDGWISPYASLVN